MLNVKKISFFVGFLILCAGSAFAGGGPGQSPGQQPQPGCHQSCPSWKYGDPGQSPGQDGDDDSQHTVGGAVKAPTCCCGEVPKKWARLERFTGNAQAPYGGHNTSGYCGISGKKVEIILSIDNRSDASITKKALPQDFDLDEMIIAASLAQWHKAPGSGRYGLMWSYVARFDDDFWLAIDLGSYGTTQATFNESPEARVLRDYLDANCGALQ